MPSGCKFHPRCPFRIQHCVDEEPTLAEVASEQRARCWVLMRNVAAEDIGVTKQVEIAKDAAAELKKSG
jgi:hypothetical protein